MKTPTQHRSNAYPLAVAGLLVLTIHCRTFAGFVSFEAVPAGAPVEGLAISNQYTLSEGMTFNLTGGQKPILAQVGSPGVAFTGFGGADDTPAPGQGVGSFFLVDPDTGSQFGIPSDLFVLFTTPTASASGVILDIDGTEGWQIQALNSSAVPIDTLLLNPSSPGAGDALATTWSFSHLLADIAGIRIHYNGTQTENIGYAWDNFSTTPVPEPSAVAVALAGIGLFHVRRRNR